MTAEAATFLVVIALAVALSAPLAWKLARDLHFRPLATSRVTPEKAFTACKPPGRAHTRAPTPAPDQVGAWADAVISLGVIAVACVVGLHVTLRHHLVVAVISDLRRVLAVAFAELS